MTRKLSTPELPLAGGCQCGQVRYELKAMPSAFYICHCTECQKQSSSGFGQSFRISLDDLNVTGKLAIYERDTESGNRVVCAFCPECGSRLYHQRKNKPEAVTLKPGTLNDTSWLQPAGHIWTRSKQAWVEIGEDEIVFDQQPDSADTSLADRWKEMIS